MPETTTLVDDSLDYYGLDNEETRTPSAVGTTPPLSPLASGRGKELQCNVCNQTFNGAKLFKRHMGPVHQCGIGWTCEKNSCKKSETGKQKVSWRSDNFVRHLKKAHLDEWSRMSEEDRIALARRCAKMYQNGVVVDDRPVINDAEWSSVI